MKEKESETDGVLGKLRAGSPLCLLKPAIDNEKRTFAYALLDMSNLFSLSISSGPSLRDTMDSCTALSFGFLVKISTDH
jgi:hypothetical protein